MSAPRTPLFEPPSEPIPERERTPGPILPKPVLATKPGECPTCEYRPPEGDVWPIRRGINVCMNCGAFMYYDENLDTNDDREPGLPTALDFAGVDPSQCVELLTMSSNAHRAAAARGYHLGKLKFRNGRA